jgi:pimeloyl-ACP methyl ester carboxylesterase
VLRGNSHPTLVLWGEQDGWLAPELGQRLVETIPGARYVRVAGGGHFLPEDQPRPVAQALASFFSA